MDAQITIEEILDQGDCSSKFELSQVDNEEEEDINGIEDLSFGDLAITGTDWTVETIISQMKKGNIQLDPSFQRRDAWGPKIKSKFIESLFLGLPIPQVILAEKDKRGKFIVIDGKQRLLSLKQFVLSEPSERPLKLVGLDILTNLNNKTYSEIEENPQIANVDIFNNQTIRTVVIKNWKKVEILYLLFCRLNTGSVKLSPQELRQALYPGEFINYVNKESAENKQLRAMLGIKKPDFRMRDVEILIRYFAFAFFAEKYSGSMQSFLDMTCDTLNKQYESEYYHIEQAMESFNNTVDLIRYVFSEAYAFKKFKQTKYDSHYNLPGSY